MEPRSRPMPPGRSVLTRRTGDPLGGPLRRPEALYRGTGHQDAALLGYITGATLRNQLGLGWIGIDVPLTPTLSPGRHLPVETFSRSGTVVRPCNLLPERPHHKVSEHEPILIDGDERTRVRVDSFQWHLPCCPVHLVESCTSLRRRRVAVCPVQRGPVAQCGIAPFQVQLIVCRRCRRYFESRPRALGQARIG